MTVKRSGTSALLTNGRELPGVFHPSNVDSRALLLERILASSQFRGSHRLREFLLYIADCALKGMPEAATEQQIGVHVFQRPPGYNSSEDSIVRTHARLLRQKLAEYFASEGASEPTILEIPKGHYLPVFRPRETEPPPGPVTLAPAVPVVAEVVRAPRTLSGLRTGAIVLGVLGVLALSFLVIHEKPVAVAEKSAIDTFWAPFLTGDPPVLIYSNTRFVGDSRTGLRYAPADARLDTLPVVDHYTGIGELAAVYELTRLFDAHRATFILKRSLLVTWDEAKSRNLIFFGSPAENPALHALPSLTDFTQIARPDSAGFVNNHPRPGEPSLYARPEHPLTQDYAIIALIPGVQSGNRTLVFSGLTTLGTQGAVEYASRKETVAELLKLASSPSGDVRPFEALLMVPLEGGVPLQAKLVSIRVH